MHAVFNVLVSKHCTPFYRLSTSVHAIKSLVMLSNNKIQVQARLRKRKIKWPMRIHLYFGWFIGIFPLNFSRNFDNFKFKLFSITSLMALMRTFILSTLLITPVFLFRPENNVAYGNKKANASYQGSLIKQDDVSVVMYYITRFLDFAFFTLPFFFAYFMGENFGELINNADSEEDTGSLRGALRVRSGLKLAGNTCLFLLGRTLFAIFSFKQCFDFGFIGFYYIFLHALRPSAWRLIFIYYEVLFFRCIDDIKFDLSTFLTEALKDNAARLVERCFTYWEKIKRFHECFSFFLFTNFLFTALFWILR